MKAPRDLLVFIVVLCSAAALWMTAALPAYGQTLLCDEAAALDPIAEIEATPRENEVAEMLALWPSRGAAVDSGTYDIITEDLDRIAAEYPDIAEIPVRFQTDRSGLFVSFVDEATRELAEEGGIPDFNCLNVIFDQTSSQTFGLPRLIFLEFDGNYRIQVLEDLYGRMPGVEYSEGNGSNLPADIGCSYRSNDGERTYFFEEWESLFPIPRRERLVKVEVNGGQIGLTETPYPYDPELEQEYMDCQAGLLGGPQVVEVPTASTVALGILTTLLAIAGLWISRRATPV